MLQVRSIIGTTKSEPVKKKSLPAKKPSLIEMAREEDPFLGKHYRSSMYELKHLCMNTHI